MREIEFTKNDGIKAIAEFSSYIDSLEDNKTYILTIKEKKKKRSLNANSYFWKLCDELAVKTGIAKTDIYKSYIREIGGNNTTICVIDKAVDDLRNSWAEKGIGWLTETMPSKLKGCTNVILYYGSSTYDTAQMSRLINLIVQDCVENDIPTLEDIELERLIEKWG